MKGDAKIRRLPFGVGQGEWQSTEWIGDEVVVRFDLKLKPATGGGRPVIRLRLKSRAISATSRRGLSRRGGSLPFVSIMSCRSRSTAVEFRP